MTGGNQLGQGGKGMVVLPQELLEKIDRNKDNLSRAEFIEACFDSLLEMEGASGKTKKSSEYGAVADGEKVVSREEFQEFKKGMKNLQRAYIEMLLDFTMEPAAGTSEERQERLLQRVRELLEE